MMKNPSTSLVEIKMVQCSNKTWIVDPTNEFRITEGPSVNKGIRGKLGSGGERSEPTDQATANSNSASKADNFLFFYTTFYDKVGFLP